MPLEFGLWRLDGPQLRPVSPSRLSQEKELEALLFQDLSLLSPDLMPLARQVITPYGGRLDVLALDSEGTLVLLELKRDKTPREVVAQTLDYAAWVSTLSAADLSAHYQGPPGQSLAEGFEARFGEALPESFPAKLSLVIVASELDPATERILAFLTERYAVPINAVFFRHFEDQGRRYLARSWLTDPHLIEQRSEKGAAQPWNGQDWYVSHGEGETRAWADCLKYSFVAAGQGARAVSRIKALPVGARIFVNAPGHGYLGVGKVLAAAVPATDALLEDGLRLLEATLEATDMARHPEGHPEWGEWMVGVQWLATRTLDDPFKEKGLFGNQNVTCKLRDLHTRDRVLVGLGLDEG